MDADRFDMFSRSVFVGGSRRALVRVLGALALACPVAALAELAEDAAGKKRKRKRHKKKKCTRKRKKKCGSCRKCKKGKCKPRPDGAGCGNGICRGRTCLCFTGYKPCRGACIPEASCCADVDCGEHGVCRDGTCRCLGGAKPCRGVCIPADACCGDDDCGAGEICLANGSCARSCQFSADCGPGCGCSVQNTEGQRVCVPGFGDCNAPTCTSTEECPLGQQCQSLTGCPPTRCVSLCPA